VVGIESALTAHKDVRAEEERQRAQRLADERARLRPERLRWYQAWMARELEAHADGWARARQLQEFLDAYERRGSRRDLPRIGWLPLAGTPMLSTRS
jgi:hypothetical protein